MAAMLSGFKKKLGNTPQVGGEKAGVVGASNGSKAGKAPPAANSGAKEAGGRARTHSKGSNLPAQGPGDGMPTTIETLPLFKDVPVSERQALFIRKLRLCCIHVDFTDITADVKAKEIKRIQLLELVEYISSTKNVFNEQTFPEIIEMVRCNLFRTLAPSNAGSNSYEPEEDEPALEPAWPHLQYVYEFLLRFVVCNETDPKVVKRYLDTDFLVRLLELFDAEDPRERDYLKTILHRIYGKFMPYRQFIRKAINHIFYQFIYETERHNGIAELLEILGSIINGFALPLKEEHKQFLLRALLPLHKVKFVGMYHQQLSYCVTQFVEKDPKLAVPVLHAILAFWPHTYSPKEVLFLNEVEEVLEMIHAPEFQVVMEPLFTKVAQCIGSPHFQVAERALFLWNNEYVVSHIAQNREQILPIVFEALYNNSRSHWNATVHSLTCNVVKLFMEMDAPLFDECSNNYRSKVAAEKESAARRREQWLEVLAQAQKSKAFGDLKVSAAALSIADIEAADDGATGVFSEEDLDMHKVLSGEYTPADRAGGPGDIRRRSVLPGGGDSEADDLLPQVDRTQLPTLYTAMESGQ